MTRPRARWPNGSMANCLQPSPQGAEIETQVHPDHNSSSPEENNNRTCSLRSKDLLGDTSGQPPMKRKRGLAKPYIDWGTDKKLVVELNSHYQPIGKNASKLASQLGVIARNSIYCPIIYTDWRCKELDSFKERIWKDVKDNCEVSDDYKDTCLMSVRDKLRKWRARLRKDYYSIYDNDEERLANVPKRIAPDQWKLFVQFQSSEKLVHVQQISDAHSSHHESGDGDDDSSDFLFDVGMKVDLLSVHLPKRVVAVGRIVSMDPNKKLGGTPLGDGFWEVHITKAIIPSENLLIGRGKMRKVRHAIGENVPWRKVDIKEQ